MLPFLNRLEPPAGASAADRNKARVFARVCAQPAVTRKQLAADLGIRPATVSALVAELLEHRLVREEEPFAANRKGRPEVPLVPVPERFAAIVVHVVSNEVRGALVDMSGAVRAERRPDRPIDTRAGNAELEDLFVALAGALRPQVPAGTELAGIGLALPGIVDELSGRWIFASRWPRMRAMEFDGLARRAGVRTQVTKNLNAELEHHLTLHPESRSGGLLHVHWGFGIGIAHAHDGRISRTRGGGFGELGHWVGGATANLPCLCGKRGCLETEAALWALLPELRRAHPDAPDDEWAFEDYLRRADLADHPAIRHATGRMITALHDLQMILFARQIIVTGPFVQDPAILDRLRTGLTERLPGYAGERLLLTAGRRRARDEITGAAAPFFEAVLRQRLQAGTHRAGGTAG